jgi:glutamyl-tRNA synthetase
MEKETVVVRFSPSPSGVLHVGSARTAIVNYLFAKSMSPASKFYLRIEDTDKERSTKEFIDIIYENLNWLNIKYDGDPVIQSHNLNRHTTVAHELLHTGCAYYCFCSQAELDENRLYCKETNSIQKYSGKCRNLSEVEIQEKLKITLPTIRIKVPDPSTLLFPYIVVNDLIKGQVKVHYSELDDFIILRSDGNPTYMLSVVVDDHDMDITHVIRGDDHFTNTFRQICIYNACQWQIPKFGHLPLIYGDDGKKLSKRRQVVGIDDFRKLGYTSDALRLYIGTMGTTVNLKNITFDIMLKTFNIKKICKSPIQFDISFLNILNQQCIKSNRNHLSDAIPFIQNVFHDEIKIDVLEKAYPDIASRSRTLKEFADLSLMYLTHIKLECTSGTNCIDKVMLQKLYCVLQTIDFNTHDLKTRLTKFVSDNGNTNEEVYSNLRLSVTGLESCPNICTIMIALGKDETLNRISYYQ